MPDWRFSLVELHNPYTGTLSRPDTTPQGTRVLGMQVILSNQSQQPMDFSIGDIRLRDADGIEYRGGEYVGSEPRIVTQNLPVGEQARGWIWFGLPEQAVSTTLVFIAPPPVLRIELP